MDKLFTRGEEEAIAGGKASLEVGEKYGLTCYEVGCVFRTLKLSMMTRIGLLDDQNTAILQGMLLKVLTTLTSEERLKIVQALANNAFTEALKPIVEKSIEDNIKEGLDALDNPTLLN